MSDEDEETYVTVRSERLLGPIIGAKVVDVTQHDEEEFAETGQAYVQVHFDNGMSVVFFIGDAGFAIQD